MARTGRFEEERGRYPYEERGRYSDQWAHFAHGHGPTDYDRAARDMRSYTEREYRGPEEEQRRRGQGRQEWSGPGPYAGRGPKGYRRSDERIEEDVCEQLMENGEIDARDIEVEVHDGEVLLRGSVGSRFEKRAAEDMADSVVGVRDVRNELQIAGYDRQGRFREGREMPERGSRERNERERREQVGGANLSVFGIYRDRGSVEKAVDTLKSKGFRNTDISALFPETEGTKDFAFEKGTKAPEGATTGGGSGIVVGGVLGWLAGIGALAIPGIGPVVAAGPIAAALAGAGVGGAVGGIAGALVGMGIPEYEAKRYEGRVKSGHILLSIHADDRDWADRAEDILDETGAYDISRSREKSADYAESDRPMPRSRQEGR